MGILPQPTPRVAWSDRLDILTEVLDALQLKATAIRRVGISAAHRVVVEQSHATLLILTEGGCAATASVGRYGLVANDCLLLVGSRAAELANDASVPATVIECGFSLRADLPHPFARQLPSELHVGSGNLIDRVELGRSTALLDGELVNSPFGVEFVAARLAEVAFVDVLRKRQLDAQVEPSFLGALADAPVRAALESIHCEPRRAWRVHELAAVTGLSRGAFADRFHRLVGEPPLRYLRSWRLLNARRSLARGSVAVRTVAERAGYRSANGFSRAFRRFFGESPSATRGRAR